MDVRCPKCSTEYELDEAQIGDEGSPVQCSECGHLFRVTKGAPWAAQNPAGRVEPTVGPLASAPQPPAVTAPMPPEPEPAPGAREWKVRQAGGATVTFTELTTLQRWIVERKVAREDEVSLSGQAWKLLGDIPELSAFFQIVDDATRAQAFEAMQKVQKRPEPSFAGTLGPQAPARAPAVEMGAPVRHVEPNYAAETEDETVDDGWEPPKPPSSAGRWIGFFLVVAGAALASGYYFFGLGGEPVAVAPAAVDAGPVVEPELPKIPEVKVDAVPAAPPEEAAAADAGPTAVAAAPTEVPRTGAAVVDAGAPARPKEEVAAEKPAEKASDKPGEGAKPEGTASFAALLRQGDRMRNIDRPEKALDLYDKAAALKPGSIEPVVGKALAYLDLGHNTEAEEAFKKALEQNGSYGPALIGLAETYRLTNRKEKAVEYYRRYLEVLPSGPEASVARTNIEKLSP